MSRQVSRGSAVEYQADEQAGVTRLSWRVSGRLAGRCRAAQLASIRQMSRQVWRGSAGDYQPMSRQVSRGSAGDYQQMSMQVSRGSAGEYQADEQAGVVGLSWRESGR